MTPASPLSLLGQSTDDIPGKLAYGLEATLFDRVVAALPGIPDDAKTRRDRISMSDPAGFPSVDAPNNRQPGGSTFNQVRVGVGLPTNDFTTGAMS